MRTRSAATSTASRIGRDDFAWSGTEAMRHGTCGYVAFGLGRDTKRLLIGAAAPPEMRDRILAVIQGHPEVDRVVELLTMYVGPDSLLVAARLDLRPGSTSDTIEHLGDQIERDLRDELPAIGEVFLDPTPGRRRSDVDEAR